MGAEVHGVHRRGAQLGLIPPGSDTDAHLPQGGVQEVLAVALLALHPPLKRLSQIAPARLAVKAARP
jgi:hypothetical protein